MSGQVQWAAQGGIAQVTLRHPGKFNAMSRAMWRELKTVFEALRQRTDIRCVVVSGQGGHFCAGGDIAEYPAFRFDEAGLRDFHEIDVWGGLDAMLRCDMPDRGADRRPLHGRGRGDCQLLRHSRGRRVGELRRADRPARLSDGAARGATGGAAPSAELTAREMLLEAAVLDAPLMLARGFLNRCWPTRRWLTRRWRAPGALPRWPRRPRACNKQTFMALNSALPSVAGSFHAMDSIVEKAYAYADSAEHSEGIASFLDKRKPVF
jgi:enoyl-CoA hydratase